MTDTTEVRYRNRDGGVMTLRVPDGLESPAYVDVWTSTQVRGRGATYTTRYERIPELDFSRWGLADRIGEINRARAQAGHDDDDYVAQLTSDLLRDFVRWVADHHPDDLEAEAAGPSPGQALSELVEVATDLLAELAL